MSDLPRIGTLQLVPASDRPDLLAAKVHQALSAYEIKEAWVTEIDPELADTAAFCAAYDVPLEISANCVVVAGKRGGELKYAACMVLATMRADVNGVVRKRLDARKASFAPMDGAVALTSMEYGGITPIGLPAKWPILVDSRVAAAEFVVIGSGVRRSKLVIPASVLTVLPGAEILELAQPS